MTETGRIHQDDQALAWAREKWLAGTGRASMPRSVAEKIWSRSGRTVATALVRLEKSDRAVAVASLTEDETSCEVCGNGAPDGMFTGVLVKLDRLSVVLQVGDCCVWEGLQ